MIRNITLGQYYPAKSRIHALDPRVKLFATFIFLISLFVNNSFTGYIFIIACFGMVIRVSRVPFRYMIRGLKGIIFIMCFSVIINIFITEGQVLLSFWIFKITLEGLIRAAYFAIRLILLILGSSLMTYTTTPNSLTDGLEKTLGFLTYLRVPVHDFATMIGIALRFIPVLSEEADRIIKAQEARGADFTQGGLMKRVKGMIPLIIPLLISAFRRAVDLSLALDARCYNKEKWRTKLHPLKYSRADVAAYILLLLYLGTVIASKYAFEYMGFV